MEPQSVYLDYNSTTPIDPDVFEQMRPFFTEHFGNPASRLHSYGWIADKAVQNARKQIATLIGAEAKEIIFTGGATESNNLAIRGVFEAYGYEGAHIISTQTEHKSVLEALEYVEKHGAKVTYIPVNSFGQITAEQIEEAITPDTILVSVIYGNNEIGSLNPIEEIGHITTKREIFFHTDAVQALGRTEIHVKDLNIDLLSMTAHKLYGPKGIGALYVRHIPRRVKLEPLIVGGGQEKGLRAGTLNVPGIVGFGKACEVATSNFHEENFALNELKNLFIKNLLDIPGTVLNGHPTQRLNNNISVQFGGVKNTDLIIALKNVACSTGSACSSDSAKPSHVLQAIGLNPEQIQSTIRFGIGRYTNIEQIDYVCSKIRTYIESVQKPELEFI